MKNTQQNQKSPHLLLNLSMIALETFYSFIFSHDDVVKQHAQYFIQQQTIVKVNLYIPYLNFYVRFTPHGLLFDSEVPTQKPNLEISSTLFGYIQAFLLGNKRGLRGIKIYGSQQEKDQFRDLLSQLALPHLLSDWHKWFLSSPNSEVTASKNRIQPLLEKIDYQRSKINSLQVDVKKYRNRLQNLKRQQRLINICFSIIIVLLLGIILYHYFMN